MSSRLRGFLDATLGADPAEGRFECSWCHRSFAERPAACPDCRGLVVRVVER